MAWLGLLTGAFKAAAGFFSWLAGYEQRKAGAQAQQLADAKGTVNEAQAARKVDSADAGLSDSDVDARLSKYSRKP